MKPYLLSVLFLLSFLNNFAQVSNIRQGNWSDSTVWNTHAIPTATDDVLLYFDITVNSNAACHSLTLNGHNVTVNTGVNLAIGGNPYTGDTLMYRFVILDTTVASPGDTVGVMHFTYDSLKRNTAVTYDYYEFGAIGATDYKVFFFNGASRLPFKEYDSISGDVVTHFYTYQNLRLATDSTESVVHHYFYIPGAVRKQTLTYESGNISSSITETIYPVYDSDNIVQQTDTTAGNQHHLFNYTYDTHHNPFYNTQLNRHLVVYQMETIFQEILSKNNALEINQFEDGRNYHYVISYQYNAAGYPVKIWAYDPQDPSFINKAVYFYGQ